MFCFSPKLGFWNLDLDQAKQLYYHNVDKVENNRLMSYKNSADISRMNVIRGGVTKKNW